MAIPYPLARFLCAEHRYRPLPPRILLLGRQTMTFGPDRLAALAQEFGLPLDPAAVELDTTTIFAQQRPDLSFVTDASFFRMLGVQEIDAIDHSAFEGANIVLDLTQPVPERLHGRFDFVFNGSVLDNIWDVGEVMRNVSRLTAPGGRIVHIETATPMPYSYSALGPSWFFDYYVANGWADCKVYLSAVPTWDDTLYGRWPTMAFDPAAEDRPNAFSPALGDQVGISVVLAEKSVDSTAERVLAQSHYRPGEQWDEFLEKVARIRASKRPYVFGEGGEAGQSLQVNGRASLDVA